MPHPHGPECQCPPLPADAGLLAYTVDCDHHAQLAAALAKIAGGSSTATLRVLTTGPEPDNLVPIRLDAQPCTGEMVCMCATCSAERSARVRNGVKHAPQPWDKVRTRRLRAA